MEKIGEKIKQIRTQKGLSQELLAEEAKVNLRTIQRIENNESEPRGKTLNLICDALKVNVEDIVEYGKKTDQTFLVVLHLSVLSFLVIPLGNILIPLILWVNKKDKIIGLKEAGANLLNFQIFWCIVTYCLFIGYAFLKIMHISGFTILIYSAMFLVLINIILSVLFAIISRKKMSKNLYPTIVKLIK
ncbi:helix-turn-helix domain-containing protein [Mesonia maritima]|uniref:helix-turn-helix domain-containing protein n=1 Tax=Mesonia maritima TaxID=1793873 RepID=UPI00286A0AF5|nr:helix-turn-helix domain-containing protein [Mesonia maritima]